MHLGFGITLEVREQPAEVPVGTPGVGIHLQPALEPRERGLAVAELDPAWWWTPSRYDRDSLIAIDDMEVFANGEADLFAIADAMHEEYKAIVDAGFLPQVERIAEVLPTTNGWAPLVATASMLTVVYWPRVTTKVPSSSMIRMFGTPLRPLAGSPQAPRPVSRAPRAGWPPARGASALPRRATGLPSARTARGTVR